MITLDYDGTVFVVTGDYLDRDVVNTINGAKAAGAQRWTLPAAVPCWLDAKRAVLDDGGKITEAAEGWWAAAQVAIQGLLSVKDETRYQPTSLGAVVLAPEQEADAQFMALVGSGMVLHPPRFGKTRVWLRTLDLIDKWPVVIAVKAKTIRDIEAQVRSAFPTRTVSVLTAGMTAPQRKKELAVEADITIIAHNLLELHSKIATYGGLKKEQREKESEKGKYLEKELNARGFRVVLIDEAHRAGSPTTAITRAGWWLGDHAEHRFIATGTPAPNREDEWWPLVRFCYPNLFPAKTKWVKRFVNMVTNRFGIDEPRGFKREVKEDWDLIFSLMSVRREKVSAAEQVIRHIPVDLPKDQAKHYKDLVNDSMAEVNGELIGATDTMSLRHRLVQFASGAPVIANGEVVALDLPSAKVDAVLEWLSESDEKALIVSFSRPLADLVLSVLQDKNHKVVSIFGGGTADKAYAAQQAIQEGDAQVIVMTQAGAEGIELSKVTRIAFLTMSYSLVDNVQIEDRNMSRAQTAESVELAYIYARGTIDEAIHKGFIRKDEKLHENLNDQTWLRRNAFGEES